MITFRRIKKDFGQCNYQFTIPNGDIIEVEVQRQGNKRTFSASIAGEGRLSFSRLKDLKDFINNHFKV
tara:strand:+ start:365 stop:568 length:204 start_codon:yes stop_codon:yes gene_type:complete